MVAVDGVESKVVFVDHSAREMLVSFNFLLRLIHAIGWLMNISWRT